MSDGRTLSLGHVLGGRQPGMPNLADMNSAQLKPAARFWLGTRANSMRLSDYTRALVEVFRDKARLDAGLKTLTDTEKTVLSICKRYGGHVSGWLLLHEVRARGLVEPARKAWEYPAPEKSDAVFGLCAKLLLFSPQERSHRFDYYYAREYLTYPDVALLPAVADSIPSIAPISWKPSAPALAPTECSRRSPAEAAFDLGTVAHALAQIAPWRTNRDGQLPKNLAARLEKHLPRAEPGSPAPPALACFYHEMLGELGAINVKSGTIDLPLLEAHLSSPAPLLCWDWVRAWLRLARWQDGIGPVRHEPVHWGIASWRAAREFLAWALGCVAQGGHDWLDLETFLADLWALHREQSPDCFPGTCSWQPPFKRSPPQGTSVVPQERWLQDMGVWYVNVLVGTLAHLGLVEWGQAPSREAVRPCFRLTESGTAVFGAPESRLAPNTYDPMFLIIQPNHEMVAFLDAAEPAWAWPLARSVCRSTDVATRVHTLTLTRETVYRALESGLSSEALLEFLRRHSRSGVPDNVAQSIKEWGGKRDRLIVRTGLVLGCLADGLGGKSSLGRPVGSSFFLAAHLEGQDQRACLVRNWRKPPPATWHVDEYGLINTAADTDAISLAYLRRFAEPVGAEWRITPGSVQRALGHGFTVDHVLDWLFTYVKGTLPPLVELMIRNWARPAHVTLAPRLVLQLPSATLAQALWKSARCRPLLLDFLPPTSIIIPMDKEQELTVLLRELGFQTGAIQPEIPAKDGEAAPAQKRRTRSGLAGLAADRHEAPRRLDTLGGPSA